MDEYCITYKAEETENVTRQKLNKKPYQQQ